MRLGPSVLLLSLIFGSAAPAVALTRAHRGPTSPRTGKHTSKPKLQGQRTIDDERAIADTERTGPLSGYLTGGPSGHWDAGNPWPQWRSCRRQRLADQAGARLARHHQARPLAPAPPQATHSANQSTLSAGQPSQIHLAVTDHLPCQTIIASSLRRIVSSFLRCRISFVRGLKKNGGNRHVPASPRQALHCEPMNLIYEARP